MVEAGIAEKLEKEISYKEGLLTKFQLTKPEFLLFVDETGFNTNQLNDGRVGGSYLFYQKMTMKLGFQLGQLY